MSQGEADIDSLPLAEMSLDDLDSDEECGQQNKRALEETPGKPKLCKRQQNRSTPKYVLIHKYGSLKCALLPINFLMNVFPVLNRTQF